MLSTGIYSVAEGLFTESVTTTSGKKTDSKSTKLHHSHLFSYVFTLFCPVMSFCLVKTQEQVFCKSCINDKFTLISHIIETTDR